MPFNIKIGDITKQKVDAIVNSLGIEGNVYGKICESIVVNSKSKELKDFIDSKTKNTIGEMFITEGYELPCNNIIHLVTPFRDYDNDECDLLKKHIRNVVDKAIELKYSSLAIPFLGMGYNGYSNNEVYEALTSVCADIDNLEAKLGHDLIDLRIVIYFRRKNRYRVNNRKDLELLSVMEVCDYSRMPREMELEKTSEETVVKKEKKPSYTYLKYNDVYNCIKATGRIKKEDFFNCHYENYKYPYDFINEYMNYYKLDEIKQYANNLDRKKKYRLKNSVQIKKKEAFLIGFFMGFNQTVMNEFLIICGLSYTPNNDLDDFFRMYFNGELEDINTMYDLQEQYYDFCGEELFF